MKTAEEWGRDERGTFDRRQNQQDATIPGPTRGHGQTRGTGGLGLYIYLAARTNNHALDDPSRKRNSKRQSSCRGSRQGQDPHSRRLARASAEGGEMRRTGADRAQLDAVEASRYVLRAIQRHHFRCSGCCIYAPEEDERKDEVGSIETTVSYRTHTSVRSPSTGPTASALAR